MTANPPPLDAAARDELARKARAAKEAWARQEDAATSAEMNDTLVAWHYADEYLREACSPDVILALLADTARLDWLEQHPHGGAIRHPDKWIVPDYEALAKNHRGATLRAAIDAARSATPTEGDDHA